MLMCLVKHQQRAGTHIRPRTKANDAENVSIWWRHHALVYGPQLDESTQTYSSIAQSQWKNSENMDRSIDTHTQQNIS